MREAAEALDDLPVPAGKIQVNPEHFPVFGIRLLRQGTEQLHGFVLHREVLAVFKRQVGEYPLNRLQFQVGAGGNHLLGHCQRRRVKGEGVRPAPIHVPGKLVTADDTCQHAPGCFPPMVEPSVKYRPGHRFESGPDFQVHIVILAEPDGLTFVADLPGGHTVAEPEGQYAVDGFNHGSRGHENSAANLIE